MQAAAALASWHLSEAKRILVMGTMSMPQSVADAMRLVRWMQRPTTDGTERWVVFPRDVLREGPGPLRDKARRDAAVKLLLEKYHLLESHKAGATLWSLHPKLRGEA